MIPARDPGASARAVRFNGDTFPFTEAERALLAQAGIDEVTVLPTESVREQVLAACKDAAVLLVVSAKIDAGLIATLQNCRVIARYGTGVDNVDVDAATARGICVTNVPDFCVGEMADHAMALILGIAKQLIPMHRTVLDGTWVEGRLSTPLRRLQGATLGIVGFGSVGQELSVRARAFGMYVIDYHRHVIPRVERRYGVTPVDLDTLLRESDYIVLACPLNSDTRGIIGDREFRLMKPNAVLVNVARGGVVDEDALLATLRSKAIGGAALDVHAGDMHRPPPDGFESPYGGLTNVLLTPHIGGSSVEARAEVIEKAVADVHRVLVGEPPQNWVNPESSGLFSS